MEAINRLALIVRPKRRFLEWTRKYKRPKVTDEMLPSLETVYLVEGIVDPPELQEVIDQYAEEIFESMLEQWSADETRWPESRTPHVFRDWFDAHLVDLVCDLDEEAPLSLPLDEETEKVCADSAALLSACAWCGSATEQLIAVSGCFHQRKPPLGLEGWVLEAHIGGRTVKGVVSTPGSDAHRAGADFMFAFCSESCAQAFKAAWDRERGALLS